MTCRITTAGDTSDLVGFIAAGLPRGDFRRILLKPNWVRHAETPEFPIEAIVTSSRVIDAALEACLATYSRAERITVGDVPLQSCDWPRLVRQAGIDRLIEKYSRWKSPAVAFRDLRRERCRSEAGFLVKETAPGDPNGYREVRLGADSHLDSISDRAKTLRVSDYDPEAIRSSHARGDHRYLIAGSVLDCDLFVNLPKMKTHQKAGLTGALKNIVGINGEKGYLAHYRQGRLSRGGDEFMPGTPWPVVLQSRVRERLQKRSRLGFRVLRGGWRALRALSGIEVNGTRENLSKRFYVAGGSWYGNDTLWRMVYDLNRVLVYAPPAGGALSAGPQRAYAVVLDGIVAGEGNGPLQALPVQANVVACSDDPFLLDLAMARMMALDYRRVPALANFERFADGRWGAFRPDDVSLEIDGRVVQGIDALPIVHRFLPPPGWGGHVELAAEVMAS